LLPGGKRKALKTFAPAKKRRHQGLGGHRPNDRFSLHNPSAGGQQKGGICVKQLKLPLPIPEGYELVFRPWITLKNGKKLFASQVGKRAFPLVVPVKR
jgi:hypothetical protein